VEPPKYMVFFKGKDADVITQAFKEFVKVVTFEQLGVDRLFVDESHNYKNLFLYTKMILSILVYTFFTRMFDFMLPLVVKYSIVAA